MKVKSVSVVAVALFSLSVIAACGGAKDEAAPTSTTTGPAAPSPTATEVSTIPTAGAGEGVGLSAEEAEYLQRIDAYVAKVDGMVDAIESALSQTWPVAARLFEVLDQAQVSETLQATLDDVGHLSAPPRFQADHERYVARLRDVVDAARKHDQSLEDRDLVSVFIARARIRVAGRLALTEVSPTFCQSVADPHEARVICYGGPLPDGEYGVEVRTIFKRFAAEFGPRVVESQEVV